MNDRQKQLLRGLPAVASLLEHEEVAEWLHGVPRTLVVGALQTAIGKARENILADRVSEPPDLQSLLAVAEQELLRRSMPSIRPVINATGIILHTGLGRAPLPKSAVEAVAEGCSGYCSLELDLETGERGRRAEHVVELLQTLTGAEAATVVNNNAAATLLILHTFASGREVIVSRGQLIEIGGSYRLPDIMRAGGSVLKEVGTTNRTRLADYERAVSERTAMLLRVHPSNYRVVGFTEEVGIAELVQLARRQNVLAVDDIGSGALFDLSACGLPDEPSAQASIEAGADLVCFSGDKLLGGPQCGIIVGRRTLIEEINAGPLARAMRVDKMVLLALDATLRLYLDRDEALASVPALSMMAADTDELARRAGQLVEQLEEALPDERCYVCSDVSYVGGGSMPGQELPTVVVQWRPSNAAAEDMARRLRIAEDPVIVRIRDDALCFDLRTIRDEEFELLVDSVSAACEDDADEIEPPDDDKSIRLPLL